MTRLGPRECHTPRDLLMGSEPSRYFAGGHILAQSWYAPNITSDHSAGVGGWTSDDLFNFLYRDGALGVAGGPYGPMKQVVEDSLSRLPASDVHDIVAYLQTAVPAKPAADPAKSQDDLQAGGQIYAANCARCHGGDGEGVTNNFPNLAGNQSVWSGAPDNVISMVLGGYLPWHANQSAMPEFNQTLSDTEIAAVTNYVRTAWGNKGHADATGSGVATERGLASDWVMLSTGSTQARLKTAGSVQQFDDISGQVELLGDRENCMLNGSFQTDDPAAAAKSVVIAGACGRQGSAFFGTVTIDGISHPASLRFQEIVTDGHLSGLDLSGTPHGTHQFFEARINLAKPAA
jgi:mono/diheme cytochrome c family protein